MKCYSFFQSVSSPRTYQWAQYPPTHYRMHVSQKIFRNQGHSLPASQEVHSNQGDTRPAVNQKHKKPALTRENTACLQGYQLQLRLQSSTCLEGGWFQSETPSQLKPEVNRKPDTSSKSKAREPNASQYYQNPILPLQTALDTLTCPKTKIMT